MATTCRIEINDYHNDLEECRTLKLAVKYPTLAAATAAGRAIIEACAAVHGLEWENLGDQFMAYHPTRHLNAGLGAFTVEVYDANGNRASTL